MTGKDAMKKIAHDWRVKVLLQNTLGLLPPSIGFPLNERLVYLVRGNVNQRRDTLWRIEKGFNNMELLYRETGFDLNKKTVLEWGTGWHGIDLILFYLLGSKRIITIDHNPHLTLKYFISQIPFFEASDILSKIESLSRSSEVKGRWKILANACRNGSKLEEVLSVLNVHSIISRSCKTIGVVDCQKSVDLFYSESVLQRIPEKDLKANMRYIGETLMRDSGVFFHRIDQKDINAQEHVDKGLWSLNYLRYSDFVFNTFISGRFNNQNRLRESDFIEIINQSNMNAIYLESHLNDDDIDKLKGYPLAKRFQSKTLEDLAVSHSKVIGRWLKDSLQQEPMKKVLIRES